MPTFVVTNRQLPVSKESIGLYSGNLVKLVKEVIPSEYENIWLTGGTVLTQEFLQLDLIDEIRLSVIPVLLGSGVPLFSNSGTERALHLINSTAYSNSIVEICYDIMKPEDTRGV